MRALVETWFLLVLLFDGLIVLQFTAMGVIAAAQLRQDTAGKIKREGWKVIRFRHWRKFGLVRFSHGISSSRIAWGMTWFGRGFGLSRNARIHLACKGNHKTVTTELVQNNRVTTQIESMNVHQSRFSGWFGSHNDFPL